MEYLKFILLTTLVVALNFLHLSVFGNTDLSYRGISSTGRAFEYDSYPTESDTEFTIQNKKGFGVPAPTSHVKVIPTIVSPDLGEKKQEVSDSKDTNDEILDDIDIDDGRNEDRNEKKQQQQDQQLSLYSAMKLIGQNAVKQYQIGQSIGLDDGRIIKGFGMGFGKIGK